MNSTSRFILIVVLIALAGGAGFWIGRHHGAPEDEHEPATTQSSEEDKTPLPVTVAAVEESEISDTITAYGSVIADPGEVRVLSAQFEARVVRVMVTPGQEVAADAEVIQLEASPDTKVALKDAQNALDAARRDLEPIKQRFEQQLATQQELSTAELSLKSAQLKVQSLTDRGADQPQHLKAPMAGVVSKVDVQEGQIVPAGGPLLEIAAQNRIQVKLGVEPSDAAHLKTDQVVQLRRLEGSSEEDIEGRIRLIGKRVDPTTRLVDVIVTPPADSHLMLDSFIAGRLTRETAKGLVVPREAIVAEEGGEYAIFTVEKDKAAKHTVRLGVENRKQVQIICDDVKPDDRVVISGTYALEDGSPVDAVEAKTEATSEPSTEPATMQSSKKPEAP